MKMSAYQIKTTKTGELDYSDDEPQEVNGLVQILQYATFQSANQSESDYNLADGESIELGYSVTNLGNYRDMFFIGLYSKTTKFCDVGRAFDEGIMYGECEGGYYAMPISDDCDEELDIKISFSGEVVHIVRKLIMNKL